MWGKHPLPRQQWGLFHKKWTFVHWYSQYKIHGTLWHVSRSLGKTFLNSIGVIREKVGWIWKHSIAFLHVPPPAQTLFDNLNSFTCAAFLWQFEYIKNILLPSLCLTIWIHSHWKHSPAQPLFDNLNSFTLKTFTCAAFVWQFVNFHIENIYLPSLCFTIWKRSHWKHSPAQPLFNNLKMFTLKTNTTVWIFSLWILSYPVVCGWCVNLQKKVSITWLRQKRNINPRMENVILVGFQTVASITVIQV